MQRAITHQVAKGQSLLSLPEEKEGGSYSHISVRGPAERVLGLWSYAVVLGSQQQDLPLDMKKGATSQEKP